MAYPSPCRFTSCSFSNRRHQEMDGRLAEIQMNAARDPKMRAASMSERWFRRFWDLQQTCIPLEHDVQNLQILECKMVPLQDFCSCPPQEGFVSRQQLQSALPPLRVELHVFFSSGTTVRQHELAVAGVGDETGDLFVLSLAGKYWEFVEIRAKSVHENV